MHSKAQPQAEPQRENRGLCGASTPGCYRELTPHEFHDTKDMGVVLLKVPGAAAEFTGYRSVFVLGCSTEIDSVLPNWPREVPLGLVCADGSCSSRMAIRLSRQGYRVFHLAGGLLEWQQCRLA